MLNTLHNFKLQIIRGKNVWIQTFKKCSTATKSSIENNIQQEWIKKNQKYILETVNSSSFQIKKYIEESKAISIVSNRSSRGFYLSLDDFLSRNKIESNVLTEFYKSIIHHKAQQKQWRRYKVVPDIQEISVPKTVLGIHVGVTAITWTLINCNSKILDWNSHIWYNQISNITTFELITLASLVVERLPESASYVIEDFAFRPKEIRHQTYRRQLTIAIMSCIKFKEMQKLNDNIYMLWPQTAARMFGLLVGNEAIATKKTVNNILKCNIDVEESEDGRTDMQIEDIYKSQTNELREQMGWSLLNALTFNRLLLIWNHNVLYKWNSQI